MMMTPTLVVVCLACLVESRLPQQSDNEQQGVLHLTALASRLHLLEDKLAAGTDH